MCQQSWNISSLTDILVYTPLKVLKKFENYCLSQSVQFRTSQTQE